MLSATPASSDFWETPAQGILQHSSNVILATYGSCIVASPLNVFGVLWHFRSFGRMSYVQPQVSKRWNFNKLGISDVDWNKILPFNYTLSKPPTLFELTQNLILFSSEAWKCPRGENVVSLNNSEASRRSIPKCPWLPTSSNGGVFSPELLVTCQEVPLEFASKSC